MEDNLYFYSTNATLAYDITKKYFKDLFYVWCTPAFDCKENPASSNPKEIYERLKKDILTRDNHSPKIKETKLALMKAARYKRNINEITESEEKEILLWLRKATLETFYPLIYIIHGDRVRSSISLPKTLDKASIKSKELKLTNLNSIDFDIIEL